MTTSRMVSVDADQAGYFCENLRVQVDNTKSVLLDRWQFSDAAEKDIGECMEEVFMLGMLAGRLHNQKVSAEDIVFLQDLDEQLHGKEKEEEERRYYYQMAVNTERKILADERLLQSIDKMAWRNPEIMHHRITVMDDPAGLFGGALFVLQLTAKSELNQMVLVKEFRKVLSQAGISVRQV